MKVKLRTKIFRLTVIVLFAIYITTYVSNKYGYYEYKKHEQVVLTNEQIKKFEDDIKSGKSIDLENYMVNNKNYQTNFSKMGLSISNIIADTVKNVMDDFFSKIGKMVSET